MLTNKKIVQTEIFIDPKIGGVDLLDVIVGYCEWADIKHGVETREIIQDFCDAIRNLTETRNA